MQYLVIMLDDMSTSYCHYENPRVHGKLISLDDLRMGILFGMKENLMIQFIYPDYELPQEYKSVINGIDHSEIVPSTCIKGSNPDIIVFNDIGQFSNYSFDSMRTYVLRVSKSEFFLHESLIKNLLKSVKRLNIVFTDLESFTEDDFLKYKDCLRRFSEFIKELYLNGKYPQLNLLTDRLVLNGMNNCNAGWQSVTLAPDGKFYVCPAFYNSMMPEIGNLQTGLNLKNPQLYRLSHAPLCRICDAFQCRRCVWYNIKTTLEVNTPSHEQCVTAHLERNASRDLLMALQNQGLIDMSLKIKGIDYLDPFEIITNY